MNKGKNKTNTLLKNLGLDESDIEGINCGDITWSIIDPGEAGDFTLMLFDSEGAHRVVDHISEEDTVRLLNVSEFENREPLIESRSPSFPVGDVDDWAGVKPDSNWIDLVKSYRDAVKVLAQKPADANAAPYLFLCRHTLELQLKAIIMLGQEAMDLKYYLPNDHRLDKLWTSAYPIIRLYEPKNVKTDASKVNQIVDDYQKADPKSFSFRYPVTTDNKPVTHASFVHSFGKNQHARSFCDASDYLDQVIQRLRFSILFRSIGKGINKKRV